MPLNEPLGLGFFKRHAVLDILLYLAFVDSHKSYGKGPKDGNSSRLVECTNQPRKIFHMLLDL